MMTLLSKKDYEQSIAATRDARMNWWREARFGMFVHYGLYSVRGRMEWAMALENYNIADYEKYADRFAPKPGAPREWAKLAKAAGMKYMVLTTRHHEGFSLWDSKVNPYNSVNYGPRRDIVREFVDACREYDLKIGFYSSLMDWHHPDGWKCAFDAAARKRFNDYLTALNVELLSNYGKIDILWYDVSAPMESWEGWDSLERNQILRALQPDIIINNRSKLDEDFGTPEGHLTPVPGRDWEACMTYNDLSWGYVDSKQAAPYGYNANRILKMLWNVSKARGNLLLNIGPAPDGSVPKEAIEPLTKVGQWLEQNGEAVYGKLDDSARASFWVRGSTRKKNVVYLWNWIWPDDGEFTVGGYRTKLQKAELLDGTPLTFEQDEWRLTIHGVPEKSPDPVCNVGIVKLTFESEPEFLMGTRFPQLHGGTKVLW
ncbi:MAG: alpha-L-fucosidase [Clostridiales bacterium]|nr:alpha-L-fucosidase [Clostridiales bacterium]